MSPRGSVLLIGLFYATLQLLILPPHGFVTGDQGSKYLQTRAFADHGPFDPAIDVKARDIDPDYKHQEPKLKNRRGRLVSEFLWLLPLTTAPFLRIFGMRGLYIVPALSVVAIFLAAAALGRRMSGGRGMWTAWVVVLAAPVLVYGLEFWEHAPAAACVMVAAALLAPDARGARREARGAHGATDEARGAVRLATAGAAIAVGALFREEVAPALPAMVLAHAMVVRPGVRELIRTAVWMGLGAGAVFAAAVPMNLMMYGSPLPMHMTQDAWEVATATPYWEIRRNIVVELLEPWSHVSLFTAALVAACAASLTAVLRRRHARSSADSSAAAAGDRIDRRLLTIVHASVIVILIIAVALPLWRLAGGLPPHLAYKGSSAAHTWVFALVLFYWPWMPPGRTRTAPFLLVSALWLFTFMFLALPSPGGGQWSPRFLLPVAALLAVIAGTLADPAGHARDSIGGTADRPAWRAAGVTWMLRAILVAAVVMHADGILVFRAAKVRNGALADWVSKFTLPGDVLITDIFWFHEVTATQAATRRQLFAWPPDADIAGLAALAVKRGLPRFSVVSSLPLTGYVPPAALDVPDAPCRFVRGRQMGLDTMGLTLSRYQCEAP